jgi:hypothetical protein
MSEQLVSRYAAARRLGRDRQTIERAVRNLAPDGYHKGQPRWTFDRIAEAVALSPQQRLDAGSARDRFRIRTATLDDMAREIDERVAAIAAEPSPDRRREMALALAPLHQEYQTTYLDIGRSLGIADEDVLGARSDLIWSEMMDEVSGAANWPRDDGFFEEMYAAAWPHDDEAA